MGWQDQYSALPMQNSPTPRPIYAPVAQPTSPHPLIDRDFAAILNHPHPHFDTPINKLGGTPPKTLRDLIALLAHGGFNRNLRQIFDQIR